MFQVILSTQWKWARLPLLLATITAFTIPVLSVQGVGGNQIQGVLAFRVLATMENWAVWYPMLAAAIGLLLAVTAWGPDHRQGHTYALSLPLPRWQYAMLRLGAGFVLLAAPAIGIALGSVLASATATVPVGLTAYPVALTIRFTLAAILAFTIFFAIAGGSTRTAGYVLAAMAALLVGHWLLDVATIPIDVVGPLLERLDDFRGPLGIFGGRWMLIDV